MWLQNPDLYKLECLTVLGWVWGGWGFNIPIWRRKTAFWG